MKVIKVNLGRRSYDIIVGNNLIPKIGSYIRRLNLGDHAYIITNRLIKNKHGAPLANALKKYGFNIKFDIVPDSERSKSIKMAYAVINRLAVFDQRKKIFILAFGGGVVGDLAGFIASIYKRGIPYIQVPTTLLAQVDSAIGGKTAVDLTCGKNLIGTFYQPRMVFSDTGLLKTLPLTDIKSGLAEVIKYGVIKDGLLLKFLEDNYKKILAQETAPVEFIVSTCSRIKAQIVQQDEKETKGIRTILNFGHTLGHAIEAAGKFTRYSHGEAIALGMLVACDISNGLGYLTSSALQRIKNLICAIGLPTKIKGLTAQGILTSHYRDKKFIGRKNRFVLVEAIGKVRIVNGLPLGNIKEALKKRF